MKTEIEGKPNSNMAITKCYLRGMGVSINEFNRYLKEYNNFEMPIGERVKLIASEEDEYFYEWLKSKLNNIN